MNIRPVQIEHDGISASWAIHRYMLFCLLWFIAWNVLVPNGLHAQAVSALGPAQPVSRLAKPIPIEDYYWHFLLHQRQVDQLADERKVKGQDDRWMRGHLQASLGFSDADFAPLRASGVRLTATIQGLNSQATALIAVPLTSTSHTQLQSLRVQRRAAINAEVSSLRQKLPPQKIQTLETFMIHFYASSVPAVHPPADKAASTGGVK